jgi:hypothetical protein
MIQLTAQKSLTSSKVFIEVFMKFDPAIHTKEYLLENTDVLMQLGKSSEDFAKSALCEDFELLNTKLPLTFDTPFAHILAEYQTEWLKSNAVTNIDVLKIDHYNLNTVAHILAQSQPTWLQSAEASNIEVLRLSNQFGTTVAHEFARFNSTWYQTNEAKNYDLLRLRDNQGRTVAHELAMFRSQWLFSEEAKQHSLLSLCDDNGFTVAQLLVENPQCINHEPLYHKAIATIQYKDTLLAELMVEKHGKVDCSDRIKMITNLISQGAAYKHTKAMDPVFGAKVLKEFTVLCGDECDPLIRFKQLQGLYSTFFDNVLKSRANADQTSHQYALAILPVWQELLNKAEDMIRQHLNSHPELLDIDHTIDIFCEPGDDLLKRLMSERILKVDLSQIQDSINSTEIEPIKQSIY